jgi:hypothetical protein
MHLGDDSTRGGIISNVSLWRDDMENGNAERANTW